MKFVYIQRKSHDDEIVFALTTIMEFSYTKELIPRELAVPILKKSRAKLGIFGKTAKFGQPHCLFHSSLLE